MLSQGSDERSTSLSNDVQADRWPWLMTLTTIEWHVGSEEVFPLVDYCPSPSSAQGSRASAGRMLSRFFSIRSTQLSAVIGCRHSTVT